jgi:hypothetical protein
MAQEEELRYWQEMVVEITEKRECWGNSPV